MFISVLVLQTRAIIVASASSDEDESDGSNDLYQLAKFQDVYSRLFCRCQHILPSSQRELSRTERKGSNPERPRSLDPLPDNLLVDIRNFWPIRNFSGVCTGSLPSSDVKRKVSSLCSTFSLSTLLTSAVSPTPSLVQTCRTECWFSGKRFAGGISTTTANVWVSVAGKLRDSERKWLPRNCHDFTFESKNLGELSTVRIGHDNSGMAPKWLVDSVVVRNETTGQVAKFPCGRWLGRGVDDDSTERILVGEIIPHSQNIDSDLTQGSPRRQKDSPKPTRRLGGVKKCKSHMQQLLTDSVNNLIKYFHKSEKERESITLLLCGDNGLVTSLEMMFSLGFKSSRIFRNNLYIWDYLAPLVYSCTVSVNSNLIGCSSVNCVLIGCSPVNSNLIACSDHLLTEWLTYLSVCPITKQMYEDTAFLLDEPQIQFLVNLVSMLRSYHVTLEPSITKGLDI
ncbi:DENND5A [Bugula neritina]|uniref:DENND5A n=1 Tax=Bugula neritina TaxID=10212 RepID=A0A7J7K6X1_BUGNE|nr:DENND5A [Bugula neritina]